MPQILAQGKTISCKPGANLRLALLTAGVDLYNGRSRWVNCRGLGTCGTCAVAIDAADKAAVSEANWRDRTRRSLPPHNPQKPLRLACQTQVYEDIQVSKYDGFWGQGERRIWGANFQPNP